MAVNGRKPDPGESCDARAKFVEGKVQGGSKARDDAPSEKNGSPERRLTRRWSSGRALEKMVALLVLSDLHMKTRAQPGAQRAVKEED